MNKHNTLIVWMGALLFYGTAHASVWYVHPDSALNSIQAGIDSCASGDTVLVGPGTYVENIDFNGMAIRVTSDLGPDTTIIDGSNATHPDSGSVCVFNSGEDSSSVLAGFTIQNGSGTFYTGFGTLGGGILCASGSSPTIIGNYIYNNTAAYGGGIACYDNVQAIIDSNIITANSADSAGAGISVCSCRPVISNNTITLNNSIWCAGMYIFWPCDPIITNNTIDSNYATYGGAGIGIAWYASPTIENNSITANIGAEYGGGVYCGGDCTPQFRGNTIANNGQWGIYCMLGAVSTFRLCNISNNNDGVFCNDCAITFDSCTIANNQAMGIVCEADVDAVISWCNIYGHTGYGVQNGTPIDTVCAESNWWGDATGPYHPTANPGGLGDTVSDGVDFTPWLQDSVEWVGIEEDEELAIHETRFGLHVYPNPFSGLTRISFSHVQGAENIELKIYDAVGRLVKDLHPALNASHPTQINWDGTDFADRRLPSGVYFLKLNAGDYSTTGKLLLIR